MKQNSRCIIAVAELDRHVKHQNRSHTIVVEALAELITDDKSDGLRVFLRLQNKWKTFGKSRKYLNLDCEASEKQLVSR